MYTTIANYGCTCKHAHTHTHKHTHTHACTHTITYLIELRMYMYVHTSIKSCASLILFPPFFNFQYVWLPFWLPFIPCRHWWFSYQTHMWPGMRKWVLCAHEIWPNFWISKLNNFLCKHSSLTNFSPFMQQLVRHLMQLTDCEYLIQQGRYLQ